MGSFLTLWLSAVETWLLTLHAKFRKSWSWYFQYAVSCSKFYVGRYYTAKRQKLMPGQWHVKLREVLKFMFKVPSKNIRIWINWEYASSLFFSGSSNGIDTIFQPLKTVETSKTKQLKQWEKPQEIFASLLPGATMHMFKDLKRFLEILLLIISKSLREHLAGWLKITPPIGSFQNF